MAEDHAVSTGQLASERSGLHELSPEFARTRGFVLRRPEEWRDRQTPLQEHSSIKEVRGARRAQNVDALNPTRLGFVRRGHERADD